MRIVYEDDRPPVVELSSKDRDEIMSEAARWALPKGLGVGFWITVFLAFGTSVFDVEIEGTSPIWVVGLFWIVAAFLACFLWKRSKLMDETQARYDRLNSDIRDNKWPNNPPLAGSTEKRP